MSDVKEIVLGKDFEEVVVRASSATFHIHADGRFESTPPPVQPAVKVGCESGALNVLFKKRAGLSRYIETKLESVRQRREHQRYQPLPGGPGTDTD